MTSETSKRVHEKAESELDFADPLHARMDAESDRLKRLMITCALGMLTIVGGTFAWHEAVEPTRLTEALTAATAAASGIIAVRASMNVPSLMALRLARRSTADAGGVEPARSFATWTAAWSIAPILGPLWLAVPDPIDLIAVVVIVLPLVTFISNSMLRAALAVWGREVAQLALAQRWKAQDDDMARMRDLRSSFADFDRATGGFGGAPVSPLHDYYYYEDDDDEGESQVEASTV